ncbi:MAG: hypothetical protein ACLS9T_09770 [Streptococcus salivarius]
MKRNAEAEARNIKQTELAAYNEQKLNMIIEKAAYDRILNFITLRKQLMKHIFKQTSY